MNYYKSPLNLPKSGHELVTCYYPLRLDTYSGCSHDCKYCYAKNLLEPRGYWVGNIRPANIEVIEDYFEGNRDDEIGRCLENKLPVRLGGLTDCFQPLEAEFKITKDTLKILKEKEYPYFIVTKSSLPAENEYLDVLDKDLCQLQFTVPSLDEDLIKEMEPGASKVKDRIEAIETVSDNGFKVVGRISPIFPNFNLEDIKDLVERLEEAGVYHILVEFFRGDRKMVDRVNPIFDEDIYEYMKKDRYYYRVKMDIKEGIYEELRAYCDKLDVGFSICSDGDPVPASLNTTKNCCGTDDIGSFKCSSKCVANEIYNLGKDGGEVTYEMLMSNWSPKKEKIKEAWAERKIAGLVKEIEREGDRFVIEE